jgi:hypothetical protein
MTLVGDLIIMADQDVDFFEQQQLEMKLGSFCMTLSLNISHVSGYPNHHLRNKNSVWARAKVMLCWKFSLMLGVFTMNLFEKDVL